MVNGSSSWRPYFVSPALVKKTEALLARVKRGPASEEFVFDWIARVDASDAPSQPGAPEPDAPEMPAEADAVSSGGP